MKDYSIAQLYSSVSLILAKVSNIEQVLDIRGMKFEDKEVFTPTQLARLLGKARSTLYAQPWLMPNFGDGKRSWTYKEIQDWFAIPEEKRKADYTARGLRR